MTPIYDHRTIVGYARNIKHAQKILESMIQNIPKGWIISVRERDTSIIDLQPGFVYSIHPA